MVTSARDRSGTPALEWIASGLGAAFAVVILLYLVWDGVTASTPAAITVEAGGAEPVEDGFRVPVKVRNRGGEAASQVGIVGRILDRGREVQSSETTFDFVPGKSERDGALLFSVDPRRNTLEIRATGHQKP